MNKIGIIENIEIIPPIIKMGGVGMNPSPLGIPHVLIAQEPIGGPIIIGSNTKKIIRIPWNFPTFPSGYLSIIQPPWAMELAIEGTIAIK